MCDLGKICIPLIGNTHLKPKDFNSNVGFAGFYTEDIDYPSGEKSIYLAYNLTVHNKDTEDMYSRLSTDPFIRHSYIKRIDGVPYEIYEYVCNKDIRKILTGDVYLTPEIKLTILKYWGNTDPISNKILSDNIFSYNTTITLKAKDYAVSFSDFFKEQNVGLYI